VALHYLDNLDAKLTAFARAVDKHPVEGDTWTSRQFMFDNMMLFRGTPQDRSGGAITEKANEDNDVGPLLKGGID
ncbi:MAG: hypothetical protein GWP08_21180, partial [Nitrospiraceae bacterium]|nr:hypothetical protein [Nitrospiraceae bacterium]